MQKLTPILCVQRTSVYKTIDGTDCYDDLRDMRTYRGEQAVVAHPPCAQWSRMSGQATKNIFEKNLALRCIRIIRRNGGVLEHPRSSALWPKYLPLPGTFDRWGGYTISVRQHWWGHLACKETFLYIVGVGEKDLPPVPFTLDAIQGVIGSGRRTGKKELSKKQRSATPIAFALWLIEVVNRISNNYDSGDQC